MKPSIFPQKLNPGDEIRIVAPSMSAKTLVKERRKIANVQLGKLGLRVSYGKHIDELDDFESSSIESRIVDLHEAFLDKNVKGIIAARGGFNSNQLFRYIDYNLIRKNPKIFGGYSDITGITNAIYAKTGLVTYSMPTYSHFGQKLNLSYELDYSKKCLMEDNSYILEPSKSWFDDGDWDENEKQRGIEKNDGYLCINEGEAKGTLIGGNATLMGILQGTEYFPKLNNSVLFLEDDYEIHPKSFDANLQSFIHLPDFEGVRGIVIGRFQKATKMTDNLLIQIIKTKRELQDIPVIANVDFGHTAPIITFPIGGEVSIKSTSAKYTITVLKH